MYLHLVTLFKSAMLFGNKMFFSFAHNDAHSFVTRLLIFFFLISRIFFPRIILVKLHFYEPLFRLLIWAGECFEVFQTNTELLCSISYWNKEPTDYTEVSNSIYRHIGEIEMTVFYDVNIIFCAIKAKMKIWNFLNIISNKTSLQSKCVNHLKFNFQI